MQAIILINLHSRILITQFEMKFYLRKLVKNDFSIKSYILFLCKYK